MREAATYILAFYALANAGIIYYFFIHKQNQADREYEKKMKDIYDSSKMQ